MQDPSPTEKKFLRNIYIAVVALLLLLLMGVALVTMALEGRLGQPVASEPISAPEQDSTMMVVDGKDVQTGLIAADGYLTVKQNCTSCHSAKLITQNHLSRDRWEKSIRWMQKNQNLGDLGSNEPIILDYLAQYYGPAKQGRRKPLETPVWYDLK